MQKLNQDLISFLHNQGFVIVTTIDKKGFPHSSCKGIVHIEPDGRIFLFDVYRQKTYQNLQINPRINLTAVDEHKFIGFCLKGNGRIVSDNELDSELIKSWENRIASRLTKRLIKNIKEERGHRMHPEAKLPKPEYLIVVQIEEIIDLTPQDLKTGG